MPDDLLAQLPVELGTVGWPLGATAVDDDQYSVQTIDGVSYLVGAVAEGVSETVYPLSFEVKADPAITVASDFDVTALNTVVPVVPSSIPNNIDTIGIYTQDGSPGNGFLSSFLAIVVELGPASQTVIVTPGEDTSGMILPAPTVTSGYSYESAGVNYDFTIEYPQYVWVDLGAINGVLTIDASDKSETASIVPPNTSQAQGGSIAFTDTDTAATATASVTSQTITATDSQGHSVQLTSTQTSDLEAAFSLGTADLSDGSGSVSWTYDPPALSSLLSGDTFVVASTVQVTDSDGSSDTAAVTISLQSPDELFTSGSDDVNFNSLLPAQAAAIAAGAETTDGMGGNDNVTLNSTYSVFSTSSNVTDAPTISAGNGNYNITLGAGSDTVMIDGDGDSTITAGTGSATISIVGAGDDTFDGDLNGSASISGGGALDIDGNLIGAATIGADSTLELGGTASGLTVNDTAVLDVDSGGVTSGTIVNSGGDLYVSSGGIVVNPTINGGTLELDAGAVVEGSINFGATTTGTLKIDSMTMPTVAISGFTAGDTIDLRNVSYDSGSEASLFETGTAPLLNNNILQIVGGDGTTYNLQLDPGAVVSGGFVLTSDLLGGTEITAVSSAVTNYSTSATTSAGISPYYGVVDVKDSLGGGGTGFVIADHWVLTAAHVVEGPNKLMATNIVVFPGTNQAGGGFDAADGTAVIANSDWYYDQTDPKSDAQNDFALIYVPNENLTQFGVFGLGVNFSSGTVNITGYPNTLNGVPVSEGGQGQSTQFNDIGTVTADQGTATLSYAPTTLDIVAGYSGGPLWTYDGSAVTAYGIVATNQDAVQLTSADRTLIQNWENTKVSDLSSEVISSVASVSAGETSFDTSVVTGGVLMVLAAATASGSMVDSGGIEDVYGTDTDATVNDRGVQNVFSGGTVSDTLLTDPGVQIVSAGGSATGVQVSGGEQDVYGLAVSTTLASGVDNISGSPTSGQTVPGYQYVFSGGLVSATTISAGGQLVLSGGTDSGAVVSSGGMLVVSSGGTVTDNATVSNGGTEAVLAGGLVSGSGSSVGTTISSGGTLNVQGTTSNTVWVFSGGIENVSSGGSINGPFGTGTYIAQGATLNVLAGGSAGELDIIGTLNVTGAITNNVEVQSGGIENVSSGGMVSDASGGGGTGVVSGGVVNVLSDGSLQNVAISAAGAVNVSGGGSAAHLTVFSGGMLDVLSGGTAQHIAVSSGGTLNVLGTVTNNVSVAPDATVNVSSGGLVSGGPNSGTALSGVMNVLASGSLQFLTVESGGTLNVSSGGVARHLTVSGGGTLNAMGSISNTIVSSGGALDVFSGGTALIADAYGASETIQSGGTLDLSPVSGVFSGVIGFADGGGTLQIGGTSMPAATIDGFGPTDLIELPGIPYDSTGSVMPEPGNQLQIVAGGQTFDLNLDPSQIFPGETFLATSGAFGTDISMAVVPLTSSLDVMSGQTVVGLIVGSGGGLNVESGGNAIETTIRADGQEMVFSGGTVEGVTTIDGGRAELASGAIVSGSIDFTGVGGTLQIDGLTMPEVPINGFVPGDTFDLANVDVVSGAGANLEPGNELQITNGGETFDLNLGTENFAGEYFHLDAVQGGGTLVTENTAPCYCKGTLILTDRREVPVERLAIGDKVQTLRGKARRIKWIGRRSYAGRFALGQPHLLPVCIKAGALEANVPRRDLWISPHHAMYLEGVLIEARDLVNGVSIVQAEQVDNVQYFHIELDRHDVIVAEGAWSESFVDDDSRNLFHNVRDYFDLYPDGEAAARGAIYCAPRYRNGYEVETARSRIAARVGLCADLKCASAALRGQIDLVTAEKIEGWAQAVDYPEAPVCLDLYLAGQFIGRTLANRYRADLERAGLGSGCHSFEFRLPAGLRPPPQSIEVRRAIDGRSIWPSISA